MASDSSLIQVSSASSAVFIEWEGPWGYAEKRFKEDSADFVEPFMGKFPDAYKKGLLHGLLQKWVEAGCPPNIGKALTEIPLFKTLSKEEALYLDDIPILRNAFLKGNFSALSLLMKHPSFDAEYVARALAQAHYYSRSSREGLLPGAIDAVTDSLSPALLQEVIDHDDLAYSIRDLLRQAPQNKIWRALITEICNAYHKPKEAPEPLKNLVYSTIFEPRVLGIVRSFLR